MKILKAILAITDMQTIYAHGEPKFLSVQEQHGEVCVWYECNPANMMRPYRISIYGTGHEMPANPGKYLGTVQTLQGAAVWHVYATDYLEA